MSKDPLADWTPPTDEELLRMVEEAGGWGPWFAEAKRKSDEWWARHPDGIFMHTHIATWTKEQ